MRRFSAVLSAVVGLLGAALPALREADAAYRGCRFQEAQKFLIRKNFMRGKALDASKNARALRYRVERYGKLEGLPYESLNPKTAYSQAQAVHFMGLPLQIHKKIAPALACAEHRIRTTCTGSGERYTPHAVGG